MISPTLNTTLHAVLRSDTALGSSRSILHQTYSRAQRAMGKYDVVATKGTVISIIKTAAPLVCCSLVIGSAVGALIALEKMTAHKNFNDSLITSDELRNHNPLRKTSALRELESTLSSINATLFLIRNSERLKTIAAKAGCAGNNFQNNAEMRRAITATVNETVAEAARRQDGLSEADTAYLKAYLQRLSKEIKNSLMKAPTTLTHRAQNSS